MFKATKSTAGAICKNDNIIEYSRNLEFPYTANYENLPKPDSVRSTCQRLNEEKNYEKETFHVCKT